MSVFVISPVLHAGYHLPLANTAIVSLERFENVYFDETKDVKMRWAPSSLARSPIPPYIVELGSWHIIIP